MNYSTKILVLWLLATAIPITILPAQQTANSWHLVKKTNIGGNGFWDYLTVDAEARKLYVSHNNQVVVLDADTHRMLDSIPGEGIHGVTLVPELHKGYITNGRSNKVSIFNTDTFKKTGEIEVGKNPDAALYDPFSKLLIVFNAGSDNATVIDPFQEKVTGTVNLGGAPEAGASDGNGMIFVNLEDKSEIAAFDLQSMAVKRRIKLSPGEEPTGLAIDPAHHLLFSVCHNKWMMVLNAQTGRQVGKLPIGANVDGVMFDQEKQLAISSNGEGSLTIVQELSPRKFKVIHTVQTEPGARTLALDKKTHHIFTATARFGERPAPTADNPRPRAPITPGTFAVLEYGE